MKMEGKGYVAIQIGNSATLTNNHIMIMEILKKYKNENIRIFVPLSYGDKKYADKVINAGRALFGEKFVPITEYMEQNVYYRFLNQMDIGIFGMSRQQALGNINLMMLLGKKVFLKNKSILEHYYKNTCHCFVESLENIDRMDFKEFTDWENERINNNVRNVTKMHEEETVIRQWRTIFNEEL